MTKIICILASPRTGTNYICSVLKEFPNVVSRYEIFHPKKAHSLSENEFLRIKKINNLGWRDVDNDQFIKWVRKNPRQVIECCLLENREAKLFSFKIFPLHIANQKTLRSLFHKEIMNRKIIPLVVSRRAIDCYISECKARYVGKWSQIDTTDVKPHLDFEDFVKWYEKIFNWYEFCRKLLQEVSFSLGEFRYETFLDKTEKEKAVLIARLISNMNLNINTDSCVFKVKGPQDKNIKLSEKVENWSDFEKKLVKKNIYEAAMSNYEYPL